MGARVVIDSKSFTLSDLIDVKPWLIKPNGEEIEVYSDRVVKDFGDCRGLAEELCAKGIENVMISLGEKGAMLVNSDGAFVAVPPSVSAVSTVGAGDSTIAGFVSAFADGKRAEECLRRAVAFGSAACMRGGTAPPMACNIADILKNIKVFSI
jgi:fructose-1-phosphate kinase PfkB-like protein